MDTVNVIESEGRSDFLCVPSVEGVCEYLGATVVI